MDKIEVRILATFHRFDDDDVREDFIQGATYQVDADTADLWCDVKGLAERVSA